MKITSDYDKKYDMLYIFWGKPKSVDYSEECNSWRGHEFVIDYDKKGRIVGIEIFNWNKGKKQKGEEEK